MRIEELIEKRANKEKEGHTKQMGRYWSSELFSIIGGYLKPKDYFSKKVFDSNSAGYMYDGECGEDGLTKLFTEMNVDVKCQVKKDIKIDDEITLVAKPDFLFPSFILEAKCPKNSDLSEVPEKWIYQLETYYRAFNLPVKLGVIMHHPFRVKVITYKPSDEVWETIQRSLLGFHKQLKQLNK